MATSNNSDFPINKNGYLSFDSLSLKSHIKDRLNQSGFFSDQNYEGSNISCIIDIIAFTFNTLMYYLNRTSTESMFSDAQIYENMNRIVKLLDYKPVGNQTATLSFQCSANATGATQSQGIYTIPRYSYIEASGIFYSFNEDISFTKSTTSIEALTDLSNEKLLYQGQYQEYPLYNAIGQENESIILTPGENVIIDNFNIDVYVKSQGGTWEEWEKTPSLYLELSNNKKYEVRFNENKRYEIKFGNNINGKKLNEGDQVAIYYLESKGTAGEVGTNVLDGQALISFNSIQFNQILTDVTANQYEFIVDLSSLSFVNDSVSTFSSEGETVDEIRKNAPATFRSQYRLVTAGDYDTYVKTNFNNLIHDVKTVNNWKYVSEYMKYYYNLGISNPNNVSRIAYNQVQFGDACNFNNIYMIAVPKTSATTKNPTTYLSPSLKELILSSMQSEKTLTSEVIISDPIYMALNIGVPSTTASLDDIANTQLLVVKDAKSRRNNDAIKNDIVNILVDYFDKNNVYLGQLIDIKQLTSSILSVNGVKTFYTQHINDTGNQYEGLSMMMWNPTYINDISILNKNIILDYFKFPYLDDKDNLSNKIVIQAESQTYEGIEY